MQLKAGEIYGELSTKSIDCGSNFRTMPLMSWEPLRSKIKVKVGALSFIITQCSFDSVGYDFA